MHVIDLETWERREHFAMFQGERSCNYGVTVPVEATALLARRRERKAAGRPVPLSACLYYALTRAANAVPELRTRLVDRRPVQFDRVDAAFTHIPPGRSLHANVLAAYDDDFAAFAANVAAAEAAVAAAPTLFPPGAQRQDLIYLTIVPWFSFTDLVSPWGDCWTDSVPRLSVGRAADDGRLGPAGRSFLPVTLEALHSLADGIHLAAFYDRLQELLDAPEAWLK
ncbi:MAG: CatA-like O-acetyltransferase [Desulfovibrionaceae bacterium]